MFQTEKSIRKQKFQFQRCFYSLIGLGTTMAIILLTVGQIKQMNKDDSEFSICLVFLLQAISVLIALVFTAITYRIVDAVLTTLMILVLAVYTIVHFYLRYVVFPTELKDDFSLLIVRLAFVVILLILVVPWSNVLVLSYRKDIGEEKPIARAKSTTFFWFLSLDFLTIICMFLLTIRNQNSFDFDEILRLTVGFPLCLIWFVLGLFMIKKSPVHWLIITIFVFLSLIQIFHLISLSYSTINDYRSASSDHQWRKLTLLILRCVNLGTDYLLHTLTIIISCVLSR